MKNSIGTVTISGKTYKVEVRNGERFVDGLPVEEFVSRLDALTINDMAAVGRKALQDEKNGKNQEDNGYQNLADKLHSRRVN